MKKLSRLILNGFGWKATGTEKLCSIPKYIIAIGPHTSNWDFLVGILVRKAYGLEKVKFLGKASLFRFPYGFIFRGLGGHPVIRTGNKQQVDSYIQTFNTQNEFAIVIAPEGTRKKVDRLKTGYYFIAKGAKVPIIPTIMNYKTKSVDFGEVFYPGPDVDKDLLELDQFFKKSVGKYPGKCYG